MTKTDVIAHYDRLVAEDNDPVRDPEPLRAYMDKWDGKPFLDALELSPTETVLEIGVGTGRLAMRVAPFCKEFFGIDLSSDTIYRAAENLLDCRTKVNVITGDFMEYDFARKFGVIYSSLTFMHIEDKQSAVGKVAELLKKNGRFVLSIDKNTSEYIDLGTQKLKIYPDTPENIRSCFECSGLMFLEQFETEFAYIIVAKKL